MEQQERKTRRDARVDQIGFCNELDSRYTRPLKDALKGAMQSRQIDVAEADFFQGLLISSEKRTVDSDKFLRLYERGEITRTEYLSAVTVNRSSAIQFIAAKDLDKLCSPPEVTIALRVTRKKNAEVQLVDCVASLTAALQAQPDQAGQ